MRWVQILALSLISSGTQGDYLNLPSTVLVLAHKALRARKPLPPGLEKSLALICKIGELILLHVMSLM